MLITPALDLDAILSRAGEHEGPGVTKAFGSFIAAVSRCIDPGGRCKFEPSAGQNEFSRAQGLDAMSRIASGMEISEKANNTASSNTTRKKTM